MRRFVQKVADKIDALSTFDMTFNESQELLCLGDEARALLTDIIGSE